MKIKTAFLLMLLPLLLFIGNSCNDDSETCCVPLKLVGEYYLQSYTHEPNDSESSVLYTTLTYVGGNVYPEAIKGDLVINSDNTFTNSLQLVFERDSITIDTIQKDIFGSYTESHTEGNCDRINHLGEISFISNGTTDTYSFGTNCRGYEETALVIWGKVEQEVVWLTYLRK